MSRYAGTSEKRELLIGDLHDVLPPPLWHSAWTPRRAACPLARFLPRQPYWDCRCILFCRLHLRLAFFGFQILDSLWFELRSTHVSLLHCPHSTTATRHPFARMPLQACRRRLRLPQRGALSVHQADWALDLCGRAAEPLRLPHNSALAREWHRTLRASGRRLCLKTRDFGTDHRKRSSWQQRCADVR
jgi:hypothetical protein